MNAPKSTSPQFESRLAMWLALTRCRFLEGEYRTVGGIAWSILNPLFTLALLHGVFSGHFSRQLQSYPLYLLIGIVSVNFFAHSTTLLMNCLRVNRDVLLNSIVPRDSLVAAEFTHAGAKFLVELLLCLGISLWLGEASGARLLLLLPTLVCFGAFILGTGMVLALGFCLIRDLHYLWTLLGRLLYFATPVFYALDSLPPATRAALRWLNPVTPFVICVRSSLMKSAALDPTALAQCFGLGTLTFAAAAWCFLRWNAACVERA